jgi:hypothetical protein
METTGSIETLVIYYVYPENGSNKIPWVINLFVFVNTWTVDTSAYKE